MCFKNHSILLTTRFFISFYLTNPLHFTYRLIYDLGKISSGFAKYNLFLSKQTLYAIHVVFSHGICNVILQFKCIVTKQWNNGHRKNHDTKFNDFLHVQRNCSMSLQSKMIIIDFIITCLSSHWNSINNFCKCFFGTNIIQTYMHPTKIHIWIFDMFIIVRIFCFYFFWFKLFLKKIKDDTKINDNIFIVDCIYYYAIIWPIMQNKL